MAWRIVATSGAGAVVLLLAVYGLLTNGSQRAGHMPATVGEAALLGRANEYMSRGNVDDVKVALTVYRRVLAMSPSSAPALAGVATAESTLAYHHRDPREAQAALLTALDAARIAPDDPRVLGALARSLHAAGRLEDATAAYQKALRAAPDQAELLDDFATLHFQRGHVDEAVRVLRDRWNQFEPDPAPAGLLGVVLTELGLEAQARQWTRLAADLVPDGGLVSYWQGLVAYREGRLDDAQRALTPLVADPDPGAHVVSLASLVLARRRGPAAALPGLAAAAETLPEASNVRSLLADVYRAVGRDDDERRERERVLAICRRGAAEAPQGPMWPRCLASQFALAGEIDAAVSSYDHAVRLGWRRLDSDRADGWLMLLGGDARFREIQRRMTRDLERMRRSVEREGVPIAPAVLAGSEG